MKKPFKYVGPSCKVLINSKEQAREIHATSPTAEVPKYFSIRPPKKDPGIALSPKSRNAWVDKMESEYEKFEEFVNDDSETQGWLDGHGYSSIAPMGLRTSRRLFAKQSAAKAAENQCLGFKEQPNINTAPEYEPSSPFDNENEFKTWRKRLPMPGKEKSQRKAHAVFQGFKDIPTGKKDTRGCPELIEISEEQFTKAADDVCKIRVSSNASAQTVLTSAENVVRDKLNADAKMAVGPGMKNVEDLHWVLHPRKGAVREERKVVVFAS